MLIHDASGSVAVVSAETVKIAGEGCIVLNARAVYIHNQALTPGQAAIVKRGVMATLDDPAALEYLHGKHDVASVDLPRSSFLRCLKGLVCAITSLSLRRKEPKTMNQGAVK